MTGRSRKIEPEARYGLLLALIVGFSGLASGCATLPALKRELAAQPPRRTERKEQAVAAFEAQRNAAQLEAALNRFAEGNEAACYQQLVLLVERNPQFADARLQLAELHLHRGQLAEAESQIRAALALASDRAEFHDCLARVLEQGARGDQAARHFQMAAAIEPAMDLDRTASASYAHSSSHRPSAN